MVISQVFVTPKNDRSKFTLCIFSLAEIDSDENKAPLTPNKYHFKFTSLGLQTSLKANALLRCEQRNTEAAA
ncbi:hypothetical protein D8T59_22740 [Vibrio vulnificus]|nr:hypothetical protein D8T59_22740 [Vibrio vulnificus]